MAPESRHVAAPSVRHRIAGPRWLGTALGVGGAVLMFLGWWGVSGAASIAEQLPYVASGSIPGAALVVASAVILARESNQPGDRRSDELIAQLHALLVEEVSDAPPPPAAPAPAPAVNGPVALAAGDHYHRPECVLVTGKAGVEPVGVDVIEQRHLSACQVCEPEQPAG